MAISAEAAVLDWAQVARGGVCVLKGPPRSGKSFLVRRIIDQMKNAATLVDVRGLDHATALDRFERAARSGCRVTVVDGIDDMPSPDGRWFVDRLELGTDDRGLVLLTAASDLPVLARVKADAVIIHAPAADLDQVMGDWLRCGVGLNDTSREVCRFAEAAVFRMNGDFMRAEILRQIIVARGSIDDWWRVCPVGDDRLAVWLSCYLDAALPDDRVAAYALLAALATAGAQGLARGQWLEVARWLVDDIGVAQRTAFALVADRLRWLTEPVIPGRCDRVRLCHADLERSVPDMMPNWWEPAAARVLEWMASDPVSWPTVVLDERGRTLLGAHFASDPGAVRSGLDLPWVLHCVSWNGTNALGSQIARAAGVLGSHEKLRWDPAAFNASLEFELASMGVEALGRRLPSRPFQRVSSQRSWSSDRQVLSRIDGRAWALAVDAAAGHPVVAFGGDGGQIKVISLLSGELLWARNAHRGSVFSLAFCSYDGTRTLVSGGQDRSVRLWNVETGEEQALLARHDRAVLGVSAEPVEGVPLVISAGADNLVVIWRADRTEPLEVLSDHSDWVWEARVTTTASGPMVASVSDDASVGLRHLLDKGSPMRRLLGHSGGVSGVRLIADAQIVVTGGHDGSLRLWDVASATEVAYCQAHSDWIRAIDTACVDGTNVVATGSDDGSVRLWTLGPLAELGSIESVHLDGVLNVRVLGDQDDLQVLTTGFDGRLVRSRPDRRAAHSHRGRSGTDDDGPNRAEGVPWHGVAGGDRGDDVTVVAASDSRVDVVVGGESRGSWEHDGPIAAVACSSGSEPLLAASAGHDGRIVVYDVGLELKILDRRVSADWLTALTLTGGDQGRSVIAGGSGGDVFVCGLSSAVTDRLPLSGATVTGLASWQRDGVWWLAVGRGDGTLEYWPLASAARPSSIREISDDGPTYVVCAPSTVGAILLAAAGRVLHAESTQGDRTVTAALPSRATGMRLRRADQIHVEVEDGTLTFDLNGDWWKRE